MKITYTVVETISAARTIDVPEQDIAACYEECEEDWAENGSYDEMQLDKRQIIDIQKVSP